MIKNWELFLESYEDDSDDIDKIKQDFLKSFEPFTKDESEMRKSFSDDELYQYIDVLLQSLKNGFKGAMERKSYPQELADKIHNHFNEALVNGKEIMFESSFNEGLISIIDVFLELVNGLFGDEGEEWKKPKEVEYEDMTKSEISKLIDDALDRRDFAEVRNLSKYLESVDYSMEEMVDKSVDCLIKIIDILYKKYV